MAKKIHYSIDYHNESYVVETKITEMNVLHQHAMQLIKLNKLKKCLMNVQQNK